MRLSALLLLLLLTSCTTFHFPGVHRITIQQGNVITQAMVDTLKPGMSKSQVRFVLGNAVLDDSLDQSRWDYVYSIQLPDGVVYHSLMSLYFIDDRLTRFEGDFKPTPAATDQKTPEPGKPG